MSGLSTLISLVGVSFLLLTIGLVNEVEGRVLYSFHKQTNKSNNTILYNDVTKWDVQNKEKQQQQRQQKLQSDRKPQAAFNDVRVGYLSDEPLIAAESMSEKDLLREMHKQILLLRNNMANLKYQNHMIYKQLKRYNNRCMQGTAPMPESAALRTCPRDFTWNDKTNKCYKFANDRITWRMAREKCRNLGADLVSVQSQKEQRFIVDTARTSKDLRHCDFWAGASDMNQDNAWRWVSTKSALSYTNWNHNEPNNGNGDEHCMHMLWVFGWMWNDARCNYESSCYICEIRRL